MAQYGNESRVPWWRELPGVPGDSPTYANNPEMLAKISGSNHQHPDHGTDEWVPQM